jgi:hypothetical protein
VAVVAEDEAERDDHGGRHHGAVLGLQVEGEHGVDERGERREEQPALGEHARGARDPGQVHLAESVAHGLEIGLDEERRVVQDLLPGANAKHLGVAAFVQNRSTSEVLQALMLPACPRRSPR